MFTSGARPVAFLLPRTVPNHTRDHSVSSYSPIPARGRLLLLDPTNLSSVGSEEMPCAPAFESVLRLGPQRRFLAFRSSRASCQPRTSRVSLVPHSYLWRGGACSYPPASLVGVRSALTAPLPYSCSDAPPEALLFQPPPRPPRVRIHTSN